MNVSAFLYSILLLIMLPVLLPAQLKCPPLGPSDIDPRFNVTLGVGPTMLYGDIKNGSRIGLAGSLKVDYRVYKGLFAGIEGQWGLLRSYGKNYDYEPFEIDYSLKDPRFVKNYYYSGALQLTVFPALFFDGAAMGFRRPSVTRIIVNGLYLGIGAGVIVNNYNELYDDTDDPNAQAEFVESPDGLRYKTPTKNFLWPILHAGFAIPLNKYSSFSGRYWSLVANCQVSFAAGDQLDAYQPAVAEGTNPKGDAYNFNSIGLKYTF